MYSALIYTFMCYSKHKLYKYTCVFLYVQLCLLIYTLVHICVLLALSFSHFSFLLSSLSHCVHRVLGVFGNPLGCVQGVPDRVTNFDYDAMYHEYYETARCGDNCTELTVYMPSNGVCVQCPNGMRARGVGALNCSVLLPTRCSLRAHVHVYVYLHTCICVSVCM